MAISNPMRASVADCRLPIADFSYIDAWAFDLDNTLYPADCNLFREIDARMTAYIETHIGIAPDHARRLQKDLYVRHGTTLAGLMNEHAVDPEDFLAFVHDIDLSVVAPNPLLGERICALPGRKFVFTNGSTGHAERVMARLGVGHAFDAVFDIKAADWRPKPLRETYDRFLAHCAIAPKRAAMFDDIAQNLAAAYALGMTTVLVASAAAWVADEPAEKRPALPGDRHAHVHHVTDDLTAFIGALVAARQPATA